MQRIRTMLWAETHDLLSATDISANIVTYPIEKKQYWRLETEKECWEYSIRVVDKVSDVLKQSAVVAAYRECKPFQR